MNKRILLASGAAIMLLAACQPAPNDTVAVPTTANTNAVNTVAAASATAKAAPTATQPAPTATPLPTATRAPTQTPEPAPTRAPDDAAPWAGKLKRIPGASDPDGFVYEVPPEAMAGIEDWVRRYQAFIDKANASPESLFAIGEIDLQHIVHKSSISRTLAGRQEAKSLWLQKTSIELDSTRGMSSNYEVQIVFRSTPLGATQQYDRNTLNLFGGREAITSK